MKLRTVRFIACLCLVALLLAGCSKQESGPGEMGSEVWKEMPKLTYGVLETDPLEVLSWNNGRAEATSRNLLAETELGYYFFCHGYLYYADKANLENWVLVCNKPNCEHWDLTKGCNAYIMSGYFIINDNRIYFQGSTATHRYLFPYEGNGRFLVSMAADGTDVKLAYAVEDAAITAGSVQGFLTSQFWLYLTESLDKEGSTVRRLYCVKDSGVQEIPLDPNHQGSAYIDISLYGDNAFYCNALESSEYGCVRFVNGELEEVEMSGLDTARAYLSGNTLRCFRKNDGYYDIDVNTREEVFLAPAQLKNSLAVVMLPNCIVESTLFDSSGWTNQEDHQMTIFDGKTWRAVKLPDELIRSGDIYTLTIASVNSDSIFFYCQESKNYNDIRLYRIPLTDGELTAEYCCDIKTPTQESAKVAQ